MKQNQVNFTVTAAEKKQIEKLAEACGLSQGEYLRQRALGFEPKAFPPGDGYWRLHSDLLWLMNHAPSPEYEPSGKTISWPGNSRRKKSERSLREDSHGDDWLLARQGPAEGRDRLC